jgi:hypothetical protein
MKGVSFIALVFVLLLKADDLAAQNREVVLNYEDPIGADLIVALAPHAADLSQWAQQFGSPALPGLGSIKAVRQTGVARSQFTAAIPQADSQVRSGAGSQSLTTKPMSGGSIELRSEGAQPTPSPSCGRSGHVLEDCVLSSTTSEAVRLLAKSGAVDTQSLQALMQSGGIIFDERSVKRVTASIDPMGQLNYVDLIGLLRSERETLSTFDSTSPTVLRIHQDGRLELLRREQDVTINLRDVTFGFERSR